MGTSVSVNQTASNGPMPEVLAKLGNQERLSDQEFAQYLMYIYAMLTHHWQVYYQFQNGMIEKGVFDAYVSRLQVILGTSLARSIWHARVKKSFPIDF
jgi:hypothetical protein